MGEIVTVMSKCFSIHSNAASVLHRIEPLNIDYTTLRPARGVLGDILHLHQNVTAALLL